MLEAYKLTIFTLLLSTAACSTLNESIQIGGAIGATSGAAATYAAQASTGKNPALADVATGAGIGLVAGLVTSYFVHGAVEKDRQSNAQQPEMYFGDLPPSPFVFPKTNKKGGQ